jgi:hypothetical protein
MITLNAQLLRLSANTVGHLSLSLSLIEQLLACAFLETRQVFIAFTAQLLKHAFLWKLVFNIFIAQLM